MFDIEKAVQSILDGNKWLKINSRWDYKEDYNGRKALIRRSGDVNIAIAGMRPPDRDCDEFYIALKIINEVEKRSQDGNSKL